jgi:hypothetical protein
MPEPTGVSNASTSAEHSDVWSAMDCESSVQTGIQVCNIYWSRYSCQKTPHLGLVSVFV